MTTYFQRWYAENRDTLLNKRRKRYREDKDYAEKCRENARNRPRVGTQRHGSRARRPVAFVLGGRNMKGWTVAHLAKRLGRSVPTIRNWVKSGAMPDSPIRTDMGHRLYTDGMILVVRKAVAKRGRISAGDLGFHMEVSEGWLELGVKT